MTFTAPGGGERSLLLEEGMVGTGRGTVEANTRPLFPLAKQVRDSRVGDYWSESSYS